jgi:hypothetical protein
MPQSKVYRRKVYGRFGRARFGSCAIKKIRVKARHPEQMGDIDGAKRDRP